MTFKVDETELKLTKEGGLEIKGKNGQYQSRAAYDPKEWLSGALSGAELEIRGAGMATKLSSDAIITEAGGGLVLKQTSEGNHGSKSENAVKLTTRGSTVSFEIKSSMHVRAQLPHQPPGTDPIFSLVVSMRGTITVDLASKALSASCVRIDNRVRLPQPEMHEAPQVVAEPNTGLGVWEVAGITLILVGAGVLTAGVGTVAGGLAVSGGLGATSVAAGGALLIAPPSDSPATDRL